MMKTINNLDDVQRFMQQLVGEGTNAHPDEDFDNYIRLGSDEPAYTAAEAELRNRLMAACFTVCEHAGTDIYDLMKEVYLVETGLDQYIPLPSEL